MDSPGWVLAGRRLPPAHASSRLEGAGATAGAATAEKATTATHSVR